MTQTIICSSHFIQSKFISLQFSNKGLKLKTFKLQNKQSNTRMFASEEKDDSMDSDEFSSKLSKKKAVSPKKSNANLPQYPIFFRYMRMNEIGVSITYYHNKNSFFNSKDLKIKIIPFIRHGKFVTFKRIFEKYGHHCKKHFISQIPSLIKQKFLQTRENFKGVKGGQEDQEDDDDE